MQLEMEIIHEKEQSKETAHEQMFKGMFRTNVEYCKECRVMRRGD
jgi:hypothetical protein